MLLFLCISIKHSQTRKWERKIANQILWKIVGWVDFLTGGLKMTRCSISLVWLGEYSKSKVTLLPDQVLMSGWLYLQDIGQYVQYSLTIINFEINLIFQIRSFFLHDQKVKTKIQTSWEWKELLRWGKNHFSFLQGFHGNKYI